MPSSALYPTGACIALPVPPVPEQPAGRPGDGEEQKVTAARAHRIRELAGHLQRACEEERKRIARDLHDQFGLVLLGLKMEACALTDALQAQGHPCTEQATAMERRIDGAIQAMRRVVADLRPSLLDTLGLAAAVEWQGEQFTEQTGIPCEVVVSEGGTRLGSELETDLFRVLQELLTNIARHAHAQRAWVLLRIREEGTVLRVMDDGRGFEAPAVDETASFGLLGIRERIRPWKGELEITSTCGTGTTVTVRVPGRVD